MKRIIAFTLLVVMILSLAACKESAKTYDLGNSDRARGFHTKYLSMVEKFGEGKVSDGKLCGVAVVRFFDFTGDGEYEMVLGYSSEKGKEVDSVAVYGFDMGLADLLEEKITSADKDGACMWVYTDSADISYLVKGEDLYSHREYHYYQKYDSEGKPLFDFAKAFETEGKDLDGEYEKISLSTGDFEAVMAESQNAVKNMENQK